MKNNVIFYNIPEKGNDHEAVVKILAESMQISAENMTFIEFEQVYRLGMSKRQNGRPLVAKCTTAKAKEIILKHSRNLRNTPYGLAEQLPPEMVERKKHLIPSYKNAKSNNLPVKWKKDQLIINDSPQRKLDDNEIYANSPPSENHNRFKHTEIKSIDDNRFQGHTIQIDNKSQVIPSLHALFENHQIAKATHNAYAYRVNEGHDLIENSCDDGEFGVGAKLLALLRQRNLTDVMIVVTRWSSKTNLGHRRFQYIDNVATIALDKLSRSPQRNQMHY